MTTVLLVDDSRFSRNCAKKALVATGYDIVEAANGEEGLAAVQTHQPDFIFTDLLMPVLDGIGFLKGLRESGSKIPVVVITADVQKASRSQCEELGISGFLNKPFTTTELIDCIEKNLLDQESMA